MIVSILRTCVFSIFRSNHMLRIQETPSSPGLPSICELGRYSSPSGKYSEFTDLESDQWSNRNGSHLVVSILRASSRITIVDANTQGCKLSALKWRNVMFAKVYAMKFLEKISKVMSLTTPLIYKPVPMNSRYLNGTAVSNRQSIPNWQ